ncbi:hypothetical protein NCAS_0D00510 [Naumovozyma castellii]|uniref:Uncharacterized protein n=1 Tax=Naumovozyma castellii TaxID=27288 RepID=G0VF13_NAUCA|nr:hypothetical protein NCAS_0D00510 [Naumovozyma castellii CBS 4309]CCC69632.1 hypothetical protein NCAS_0D00510 [Naumovozyma castellii CBS 4309]
MSNTVVPAPKPTVFSLLINLTSLAACGWGLRWAATIELPPSLKQAGHKQFLTNISVIATLISNVTNVANFFIQRNKDSIKCKKLRDRSNFISRNIALPIALVLESIVPLIYWPLRLFFLPLIMQGIPSNDTPSPVPISVDCCIHLFPFIFLMSDHYLSGAGTKFQLSNARVWVITTALGFGYYRYLAFLIDPKRGQSNPYPFLDVEEPYKGIIFVGATTFAWLFYVLYQKFPPKTITRIASEKKKY